MMNRLSASQVLSFLVASFVSLILIAVVEGGPKKEKTVPCDPARPQLIKVGVGRLTVLDFPVPPKEILPGENRFQFVRVQNDLDIKPLRESGSTNVVVYLKERRCSFDLKIVPSGGDDIVYVRDPKDQQINWDFR
jgi:hypothetical protein